MLTSRCYRISVLLNKVFHLKLIDSVLTHDPDLLILSVTLSMSIS